MTVEGKELEPELGLVGKVAIVTGGGRGIGKACAMNLARAGSHVVVASRSKIELDETTEVLTELGAKVIAVQCDVTRHDECIRLGEKVMAEFGRIDILINNAGAELSGKLVKSDPATWAGVISVNLVGSFNMCHVIVPHMIAGGGGRIVMIGSGVGHSPRVGQSAYGSSKAGLSYLTQSLAQEVWQDGIDVNEVVPGPVATRMTGEIFNLGEPPLGVPSERVKAPSEVADFVEWLLRQRFGGPTGQVFSLARRPL